jgi:putative inorganic carbon (hco3(-)) transporter
MMHPAALLALGFMVLGAAACAVRPAWVPPYFAAVLYANAPDTLRSEYGLPSFFMLLAPALLALAVARQLFFEEAPGRGWKGALWWILSWGAVIGGSFLYAVDRTRSAAVLFDYLDALFIVLIATLFLRRREQLAPVAWALIGAGTFLALLTVHQTLTGNFGSTYGGFARGELRGLLGDTQGMRSAGPLSTNYFALVLVALVPLAADRVLHSRVWLARWTAALSLAAIIAALGCTYSRGGLVALGAVALLMLLATPHWPKRALAGFPVALAGLLVALALLPATYRERMATFGQIWEGMRGRHVEDSAIRGRISEVRSAILMVAHHPLLGVGSGNYEIHYPQYARVIGLDARREERAAHSLYLEVAAENGVLGLAVFGGLLGYALSGIQRARRSFAAAGDDGAFHLATAIGVSLAGFLIGSMFLHLSYPRFFWLLVGIAMAVRGLSEGPPAERLIPLSRVLTAERSRAGVQPCA